MPHKCDGPQRLVSDSLHVMHCHCYKMLEVQYLQTIQARAKGSALFNQIFEPFPASDEKNDWGLNTIVPSAQWCRDIYDNFLESHEHEYHQHTAMLSSEVMAIDHSFKVCAFVTLSHYLCSTIDARSASTLPRLQAKQFLVAYWLWPINLVKFESVILYQLRHIHSSLLPSHTCGTPSRHMG